MAKLLIVRGTEAGRELPLTKDTFTIGRLPDNDYELDDSEASRKHLSVVRRADGFVVEDHNSANGTFVNETPIQSHVLRHGDRIRIGQTAFLFVVEQPLAAKAPAGPAPQFVRSIMDLPKAYRMDLRGRPGEEAGGAAEPLAAAEAARGQQEFFVLYQLAKALTSAADIDGVLDTALKLTFDVIQAERGAILLVDRASSELIPRMAAHRAKGRLRPDEVVVSRTIARQVLTDRVSLISSDAQEDARLQGGLSIVQLNIRSALCVPLWDQEEAFGVLYLDNVARKHAFTEKDSELLAAIANLIAIQIRQAELQSRLRTEQVIRATYQRNFSPDIVEMMIREPGRGFPLEEKEVSIMFCDVQGSTNLAERMPPGEFAELLNGFLEAATTAIFDNHGHVNKYLGDGVLAVFGAPASLEEDHAFVAVRAAQQILADVYLQNHRQPPEKRYNIRIGVNTGNVVAGNIGPAQRQEYTVLGDAVNVTERLLRFPEVNRTVIGELTNTRVKDFFATASLGMVQLKGKAKEVEVFEIKGPRVSVLERISAPVPEKT